MGRGDIVATQPFTATGGVKKGIFGAIRMRFDTALVDHKLQWFDVYNDLGFSKSYASQIRNGHIIPPAPIRNKIADAIGVDTSVLWEPIELIGEIRFGESSNSKKDGGFSDGS